MRARRGLPIVSLGLILAAQPAAARQHEHPAGQDVLGSVSFPTSCATDVQKPFERAVAMLHSFWFEQAEAAFTDVATRDPGCAMAYWGMAMTFWGNPMTRAAPAPARAEAARERVAKARELARGATERERGWIEAAAALYEGPEDHMARMRAHEAAMRRVMESNPDDVEAVIFYGRAAIANAPPTDLTFARQLHAAEVMEPLFAKQADHPGLAHYIIHAFDAPPIAEEGLAAARRYASIAPAAPHALHMPSHIFTRLGYWTESIETNTRSAQAEPNPDAAVHPMDYMVYAYLQLGRDREAGEVVGRARQNPDRYYGGLLGYNFAAMRARYALERNRWEEAAALPVPGEAFPYVTAISRFARALGRARSGSPDAARPEVEALAMLRDALRQQRDEYWATVVDAQRLAAAAWVARAEGDDAGALRLAREAADLEETVEKHPVTPGPLLPARELEADLLLELGRPAEALESYVKTLEREPGRARALFGAARAAELAGDTEQARRRYDELLTVMAGADADRPEPRAAREFLGRR
jgi:tetratricopeptide (TPR) repeat protein